MTFKIIVIDGRRWFYAGLDVKLDDMNNNDDSIQTGIDLMASSVVYPSAHRLSLTWREQRLR